MLSQAPLGAQTLVAASPGTPTAAAPELPSGGNPNPSFLNVLLKDYGEVPRSNAIIERYDQAGNYIDERVTDSEGKTSWSSVQPAFYILKAFHASTFFGLEYWNIVTIDCTGTGTHLDWGRGAPHVLSVTVKNHATGAVIGSADQVPVGTEVRVEILVLNATFQQGLHHQVRMLLDLDQAPPFDNQGQDWSSPVWLADGTTHTFAFTYTPTDVGIWHMAFKIDADVDNGSFIMLDAEDWQQVFEATVSTGVPFCFGDGSGTPCPCNNENDGSLAGAGCANGVFASGAKLEASGTPSLSNDTVRLFARGVEPSNFGLYFQGDARANQGAGWFFGDGLRCAGDFVVRLGVAFADGNGFSTTAGWSQSISQLAGNISPGDQKYYQLWYRNVAFSPCGYDFNLTNGYAITWTP